jgi:hypothetical protein
MIQRKVLSLFCLIIFSVTASSQNLFREGYIIKNDGRLIHGLVQYSRNKAVPEVCIFKRFEIAAEISYKPEELIEFGFENGNRYLSKKVDGRQVFLDAVAVGRISLFSNGKKYFVKKGDSELTEITGKELAFYEKGDKKTFNNLADLMEYLTDGFSGNRVVSEKELLAAVTAYNESTGNSFVYNRTYRTEKYSEGVLTPVSSKIRFGVISGANTMLINCKTVTGLYYLPVFQFNITPVAGLKVEKTISHVTDRVSVEFDLLALNHSFYSYSEEPLYGEIIRHDAFLNFNSIKSTLLLNLSLNAGSSGIVTPYFSGGVNMTAIYSSDYLHIAEKEYMNKDVFTFEDTNLTFNKYPLTMSLGVGTRIRLSNKVSFDVAARIEAGQGLIVETNEMTTFKQIMLQGSLILGVSF